MKEKKIYLVSVWVYTQRTRPVKKEEHYYAVRATGYRAAQNAATRKFTADGYDVEVACVERDDHGDYGEYGAPITAGTKEELETLKDNVRKRIAKYEAAIDATNRLTDSELAGLSYIDMAWRLLDGHALNVAKEKLAALEAVK